MVAALHSQQAMVQIPQDLDLQQWVEEQAAAAVVAKQAALADREVAADVVLVLQGMVHQHRPAVDLAIEAEVADQVPAAIKAPVVVAVPEQSVLLTLEVQVVPVV